MFLCSALTKIVVALCCGLLFCLPTQAQKEETTPNLTLEFTEKLKVFSTQRRVPILAEGYPTEFRAEAGAAARLGSLESVAAQYGYIVEPTSQYILLRKNYGGDHDLPAVSVGELREVLRAAHNQVTRFVPADFIARFVAPDPKTGRVLRSPEALVTLRIHELMQTANTADQDAEGNIPMARLPTEVRSLIINSWLYTVVGNRFHAIETAAAFFRGMDRAVLSDLPDGEIEIKLPDRKLIVRAIPSHVRAVPVAPMPPASPTTFTLNLAALSRSLAEDTTRAGMPTILVDAAVSEKPILFVGVRDADALSVLRGVTSLFGLAAPGTTAQRTIRLRTFPALQKLSDLPLLQQYVPLPFLRYSQVSRGDRLPIATIRRIQHLWKERKAKQNNKTNEPIPLQELSAEMRTAIALYVAAGALRQMQSFAAVNYELLERFPQARFRIEEYKDEQGVRMLRFDVNPPAGEPSDSSLFAISQIRIE